MRHLLLLLLITWGSNLNAVERVLDLAQPHFAIGEWVGVFEDTSTLLASRQIITLPVERFTALGKPSASHTFTQSAFWFRFEVENHQHQAVERILWLNQAWLDSTNLTIVSPVGRVESMVGGNGVPFAQRAIAHPLLNFRHSFEPGRSIVYLRVQTPDPFVVTINLMDEASFLQAQVIDAALIGLVYGAILSMLLYNLLLYFGIREPYQLYYVFYLGTFLLMNAAYNNYTFPLLFADWPQGQDWMQSGAIYLFLCSGLMFTRSFLDLQLYHPKLYSITTLLLRLLLLVALCTPWLGYRVHVELSIVFSSLISFYSCAIGLYIWLAGNRSARFFLLGSMSGLVGTMVTALTVMAFLPYHYLTYKALDFGLTLDGILMSLALADRIKQVREERLRAELDSKTDSLTGLNNRRAYQAISQQEEQRLKRHGGELAAIMLDINHFKLINDNHGHVCGDALLKQIAALVRQHIRLTDHAFRMGGDEFLILLPATNRDQAQHLAERLRQVIAAQSVACLGHSLRATVSLGVSQYHAEDPGIEALLKRTDDAMYQDKRENSAVRDHCG